jgi:hypothetical protein
MEDTFFQNFRKQLVYNINLGIFQKLFKIL